jgi:glycosyltransferase involved in cell wall biosynthesis
MLTTARRWYFRDLAIEQFLLQARADDDELVIVTEDDVDGEGIEGLDPSIRVVKIPPQPDLASKRNLGVDACNQPWVTFWDDDDWHGLSRLRTLRAEVRDWNPRGKSSPKIVGQTSVFYHELLTDRRYSYKFDYPYHRMLDDPYVIGGTMLFAKDLWEKQPFVEQVTKGDEGWWTIERLRDDRTPYHVLPPGDYVAFLHDDNTCGKIPRVDDCGKVVSEHAMTWLGGPEAIRHVLPKPILNRFVAAAWVMRDEDKE